MAQRPLLVDAKANGAHELHLEDAADELAAAKPSGRAPVNRIGALPLAPFYPPTPP